MRRWNCAKIWLMSGHIEPQVVNTKFSTTGRPSFISSGNDTALPSSRISRTFGTVYCTVVRVACTPSGDACDIDSEESSA